jgi:hypothetical protein
MVFMYLITPKCFPYLPIYIITIYVVALLTYGTYPPTYVVN